MFKKCDDSSFAFLAVFGQCLLINAALTGTEI